MPMSRRFKRVLIANRGEIALRIARTLLELDIVPVAVYSDVDRLAPHVRACPLGYPLGPGPAQGSYLDPAALLRAAAATQADAIHPGYGFLSENADFAEAVGAAGLCFIGPPPAAMRVMGDKTRARAAMRAAGVPVVPGSAGRIDDAAAAAAAAQAMGYPIMLKAAAGGGGKGMRMVAAEAELAPALRAAASEARNAFGDDTIYMEKAILAPRHIEIQVFSDADGHTVALGERECSLQRRHQKVIEESPSAVVEPELRARMQAVACRAAEAVDYRGAGTVEFLLDGSQNFYFLEMNTRLQVEHPVTELCFGVDLVAAQVRVAAGLAAPWDPAALVSRGHAMEARLYAEDPSRDFLPSPGRIDALALPQGPGIRVDSGVDAGNEVSRYYDPMMAKICAWPRPARAPDGAWCAPWRRPGWPGSHATWRSCASCSRHRPSCGGTTTLARWRRWWRCRRRRQSRRLRSCWPWRRPSMPCGAGAAVASAPPAMPGVASAWGVQNWQAGST